VVVPARPGPVAVGYRHVFGACRRLGSISDRSGSCSSSLGGGTQVRDPTTHGILFSRRPGSSWHADTLERAGFSAAPHVARRSLESADARTPACRLIGGCWAALRTRGQRDDCAWDQRSSNLVVASPGSNAGREGRRSRRAHKVPPPGSPDNGDLPLGGQFLYFVVPRAGVEGQRWRFFVDVKVVETVDSGTPEHQCVRVVELP